MTERFLNPFKFIAGYSALLYGLIFLIVLSFLGYLAGVQFDGVVDVHFIRGETSFFVILLQQILVLAVLVLVFYSTGLLFSKSSIRFIDVAGTFVLARAALIPMAFLLLLLPKEALLEYILKAGFDESFISEMPLQVKLLLSAVMLIIIPGIIWMVSLFYNAYRVSCNIGGRKAVISFIAGIITAEIISIWLIGFLDLRLA